MKNTIKFYPTGNGDCSYIRTTDDIHIIVDCNFRKSTEDEENEFNVKDDLLKNLPARKIKQSQTKAYFTDVFINTHSDCDHCRGFEDNFYQGDPNDYKQNNKDNEEIIIDELWVNRKIFRNNLNSHASCLRREAKRRRKLYQKNKEARFEKGNRLVIIGYDGDEDLSSIPHYYPSNIVTEFAGIESDYVSFFIHAPFKKDLVQNKANAERDENPTSIIFQARFKFKKEDEDFAAKILMGGDADHYIWKQVKEKSEKNENTHALAYDIFLAPHHCSWSFFNDVPYTDKPLNQTPKDYTLELLDYKHDNAYIIASSKTIKDDDINPPHWPARKEYIKKVASSRFLCTDNHQSGQKKQPIVFEIHSTGPRKTGEKTENDNEQRKEKLKAASSIGVKPYYIIDPKTKSSAKSKHYSKIREEILKVSELFTGLNPIDEKLLGLAGNVIVEHDGEVLDTYNVEILIPEKYPFIYPIVFEKSGKIIRNEHHHCNSNGSLCIAPRIRQLVDCRNGYSLDNFIMRRLIPHLAQQTHKTEFGYYPIGEYSHYLKGIIEAYQDITGEYDQSLLKNMLELLLSNKLPARNDNCFCDSGKPFKKCHLKKLRVINPINQSEILYDYEKIKNLL